MKEGFDIKVKYRGTIRCTIDHNHPDIKCVDNWTKDKVFEFSDEYTFDYDEDYTYNGEYERYIKNDLSLIAGGGYNAEHIHNVTFEIQRV